MIAQRFAGPFSRFWHGIGSAMTVWHTRNELSMLDDRMLKDLGISRAQAEFEAARGPWFGGFRGSR
jgi:uncharacterized protein YjiS (DUF1127 family)